MQNIVLGRSISLVRTNQQQNLQEKCPRISALQIVTKLTASGFKEIDLATVLTKELSFVTNDE